MKRIGLGIVLGAVAMLLTLSPWSYAQKQGDSSATG